MKKLLLFFPLLYFITSSNLLSQISCQLDFTNPEIKTKKYSKDSLEYQVVSINELYSTDDVGKPSLPEKNINILLPLGKVVDKVIVNNSTKHQIKLVNPILPVQPPIPISTDWIDKESEFVRPDAEIYQNENFYPGYITKIVRNEYFDGDKPVVTIAVYPVQYSPGKNIIDYYSTIDLTVIYKDDNFKKSELKKSQRNKATEGHYIDLLKGVVENQDDIEEFAIFEEESKVNNITSAKKSELVQTLMTIDNPVTFDREYVIVTNENLAPCFTEFATWKRRKGIDIGIVTVEDIYNNYSGDLISGIYDDPGKIRQFLANAYGNGLIYALLGGVNTIVPVRYGCGENDRWHRIDSLQDYIYRIPADLYFADFNGDWDVDGDDYLGEPSHDSPNYFSEIFVGRLLCETCEDIERWTKKILLYEQNPGNGDNSYLTKCFMIQADQLQEGDQANLVSQHLSDFNETIWEEIPSEYSTEIPTFPSGAEAIQEMNTHYGLVSWFAHAGPPGIGIGTKGDGGDYCHDCKYNIHALDWWDEHDELSYSAIQENGNGLDNLTNYNYPAINYTIGCNTTPFDHDLFRTEVPVNLGMGWTTHSKGGGPTYLGNTRVGWVPFSYQLYNKFADIISNNTSFHLGEAEALSKINYSNHFISYSHNLVGCPETEIWTAIPSQFPSVSVTENGDNVSVNISGGITGKIAVMSVMDGGESFLDTLEGSSHTFYNVPKPYYLTITKHDYLPYIKNPDNIYIQNENLEDYNCISADNIYIGNNVTPSKPTGPVRIQNNSYIVIDTSNEVLLDTDVEIELGSTLIIK